MADFFFTDHSVHHHSKKKNYKNYKNTAHTKNIIQLGGLHHPNPPPVALAQIHRMCRRLAQALLIPSRLLRQWRRRFSFQTLQQQTQLDETRCGMEHTSENKKPTNDTWSTSSWPPIKTRKLRYPSAMQLPKKMEDEKFISGQPYVHIWPTLHAPTVCQAKALIVLWTIFHHSFHPPRTPVIQQQPRPQPQPQQHQQQQQQQEEQEPEQEEARNGASLQDRCCKVRGEC